LTGKSPSKLRGFRCWCGSAVLPETLRLRRRRSERGCLGRVRVFCGGQLGLERSRGHVRPPLIVRLNHRGKRKPMNRTSSPTWEIAKIAQSPCSTQARTAPIPSKLTRGLPLFRCFVICFFVCFVLAAWAPSHLYGLVTSAQVGPHRRQLRCQVRRPRRRLGPGGLRCGRARLGLGRDVAWREKKEEGGGGSTNNIKQPAMFEC